MSQPITSSELGQVCSPAAPICRAVALGGKNRAGRAIAEQGGGHDIAFGNVVLAEGERAKLDHQEQDLAARLGRGDIGGARKPDHAAGAAQAEDRQALDVAAQAHALDQKRVQAGGGDAGGGDHHDSVDLLAA